MFNRDSYECAKQVSGAVKVFWGAAGITTMVPQNIIRKINKLVEDYKAKESASKNRLQKDTDLFKNREKEFIDKMDDVFDISNTDLSLVFEESKHFLYQQRMKGRPGNITFKLTKTAAESAASSTTLGTNSDVDVRLIFNIT